jgi:hypothetical protein
MGKSGLVSGWKLPAGERARLLDQFPPLYTEVVADHVTLQAGVNKDSPPPPRVHAEVVGRADDGRGLECLVVALNESTDRPDGSTFHITWSLGPGRKAIESNEVLRDLGWWAIGPIRIDLTPAIF